MRGEMESMPIKSSIASPIRTTQPVKSTVAKACGRLMEGLGSRQCMIAMVTFILILLGAVVYCLGWGSSEEISMWCSAPPTFQRSSNASIAVLISGLDNRFTYNNVGPSPTLFKDTDVFIVLERTSSSVDSGCWSAPCPVAPPYAIDEKSVVSAFEQRGARSVVLRFVSYDTYNADRNPYPRNKRMLDLRRRVFELSNPVNYTHFLYLREDNCFFDADFSAVNLGSLCGRIDEACYAVDSHCDGWGIPDKLFYLNRKAAEIMFTQIPTRNVDHDNTEGRIKNTMQSHGVCATRVDFRRGDVRFVEGASDICLSRYYAECNSGDHMLVTCRAPVAADDDGGDSTPLVAGAAAGGILVLLVAGYVFNRQRRTTTSNATENAGRLLLPRILRLQA